jgi:C1A family cysteine protease
MKSLLLLAILVCSALASNKDLFLEFQRKYNKVYQTSEEFSRRYAIFQDNLVIAQDLARLNGYSATFGVNKFSDISAEEFKNTYLMKVFPGKNAPKLPTLPAFEIKPRGPDPNNYDWNSAGVVTPVYNQGQCGSCWAFSATETIESYFAIAGNTLTSLAVEQIVDCDTSGQDEGCNGGFPSGAYQYVESQGGLDSMANYPYVAEGGNANGQCEFPQGSIVADVTSYNSVDGESGLYAQASTNGPVSVCVDASSWQSYSGGILTQCGNNVDHCVQLTGYQNYNAQDGSSAWVVRNSWGTDWGVNGYIMIATGQDLCSIGDYATIVTAASK